MREEGGENEETDFHASCVEGRASSTATELQLM